MDRALFRPLLFAGLMASAGGSLLGALLLTLLGFSGPIESVPHFVGSTAALAFYGTLLALPFVFLYGMPLYAALSRVKVANIGTAAMFGALPGITWILWTNSNWIDPILFNGVFIATIYVLLRQRYNQPITRRIWTPPQQQEPDRLGTLG